MKKIPTLLERDPENRRYVMPQVAEGCEWVLAGEGVATRKYDGTCVMLDEKLLWWARREVKPGGRVPEHYVAEDYDEVTGKTQGWEPIIQSPFFTFWKEAVDTTSAFRPGTYELCGPRINGNPEGLHEHTLIEHATAEVIDEADVNWVEDLWPLLIGLGDAGYEGIVWHHPDGRMAKLKVRDLRTALSIQK